MKLYAYRWKKAFSNDPPKRGIIQADDPYHAFKILSGGWEFKPGLEEDEGWIILSCLGIGVLELFPYDLLVLKAGDEPQIERSKKP